MHDGITIGIHLNGVLGFISTVFALSANNTNVFHFIIINNILVVYTLPKIVAGYFGFMLDVRVSVHPSVVRLSILCFQMIT